MNWAQRVVAWNNYTPGLNSTFALRSSLTKRMSRPAAFYCALPPLKTPNRKEAMAKVLYGVNVQNHATHIAVLVVGRMLYATASVMEAECA